MKGRVAGAAIVAHLALVGVATAQVGGGFDFSWSRITAGGGTWSGGGFEMNAAVGQWDSGEMVGGSFNFLTGAWGAPVAPPSGPGSCEPGWTYGLDQGIPGISQAAYAVTAWDHDGAGPALEMLIVAGNFAPSVAGNIFATGLAGWDGISWHDLGDGIGGEVWDMVVFNGDLIVAGTLWQAGGAPVNGIARFDGSAWHAMDTGFGNGSGGVGVVRALTIYQGQLIAAGSFTEASGLLTSNIARWNGTTWEALGFGIDGQEVRALAVLGNDLYAGGEFNIAGGVSANYIARWNGTWSALGTGTNAAVYALAPLANGTLAVGGAFIHAGGSPAGQLAIWAPGGGGAWQNPFGAGLGSAVFALSEMNGHLIIGGAFTPALSLMHIAAWSIGGGFQTMGYGTDAAIWDIGSYGGRPVIVGGFSTVGPTFGILGQPTVAWGVAVFDSSLCPLPGCTINGGWRRLTPGIDGTINALGVSGGELVAGGQSFSSAGMVNPGGIARWNTDSWNILSGSIPPPQPGGTPGTAYGPGSFANSQVNSIIDYQGWAVIGGQFSDPAFLTRNISSWRPGGDYWGGLFFDPLNGSQDLDANTHALVAWDPDGPGPNMGLMLIAGGDFTTAGRNGLVVPASRIAGFRSTHWTAFGSGVDGTVRALAVYNEDLIVGGNFTQADGILAPHVARLSLTGSPSTWTWSAMGSGIDGAVHSLASHNGSLYAGGQFSTAGAVQAANIARWDGDAWHPVGDGLGSPFGSPVLALAAYRGDLYAGGQFQGSFGPGGNILMSNIGRWDGAAWHPLDAGIIGVVNALAECQGRLIVGGQFTNVNGQVSHNWARWEPGVIAPAIAQETFPSSQTRRCGDDAGFGVTVAFGTGPTFQWRRNGVPLVNGLTGAGSTIENATTPGLSIRDVTLADAGQYDCVVANSCGTVTSAPATLAVCASYADCNCDALRTVADFGCFQTRFVLGDMYADCNNSGALTIADFGCFQTAFVIGCP